MHKQRKKNAQWKTFFLFSLVTYKIDILNVRTVWDLVLIFTSISDGLNSVICCLAQVGQIVINKVYLKTMELMKFQITYFILNFIRW